METRRVEVDGKPVSVRWICRYRNEKDYAISFGSEVVRITAMDDGTFSGGAHWPNSIIGRDFAIRAVVAYELAERAEFESWARGQGVNPSDYPAPVMLSA
jgi:hypothetical protein